MTREDGSVTGGGGMQRSGPTGAEESVIAQMVADGATVKDLRRKFPDIDPSALERWHAGHIHGRDESPARARRR